MHCPACGEEIFEDSAFCRYCGEDVSLGEGEPGGGTNREPAPSERSNNEEQVNETSMLKEVGYGGGRVGQVVLVGLVGILILNTLMGNVNVRSFDAIRIFVLVLLALVGVLEFLVVRPLS